MAARTDDCDDRINHGLNVRGQCSPNRSPCCSGHRTAGANGFLVCDKCHQNTQRLLGINTTGPMFANISATSPDPAWVGQQFPIPAQPTPPWDGWKTRVCDDCEAELQSYRNAIQTRTFARTREHRKWQACTPNGLFFNTCTCRWTLGIKHGGPRRCYPHRDALLDKLLNRKNTNDFWLRNTEQGHQRHIFRASNQTKRLRREDNGRTAGNNAWATWRACRCGADTIGRNNAVEVWLCMACDGFQSVVRPPVSQYNPLPAPARNVRERYKLGRVRYDGSQ